MKCDMTICNATDTMFLQNVNNVQANKQEKKNTCFSLGDERVMWVLKGKSKNKREKNIDSTSFSISLLLSHTYIHTHRSMSMSMCGSIPKLYLRNDWTGVWTYLALSVFVCMCGWGGWLGDGVVVGGGVGGQVQATSKGSVEGPSAVKSLLW